ncbi:MAG TPA: hypothetical protein PLG48_05465, partial [Candidatus Avimonas sp.]|nr:hypothetical protein [Candidatus Avimonas sp.]
MAFCWNASAQFAYISTDGPIVLKSGDIVTYDTPDIYCDARYYTLEATWVVTMKIIAGGATTGFVTSVDIELAQSTVDALTGSGGTETRVMQNTILQAVAAYLDGITENAAVTFTLH